MEVVETVVALLLATSLWLGGVAYAPGSIREPAPASRAAGVRVDTAGWRWPLQPQPRVERGFDPPDQPWLAGHRGVDLAASAGQPVLAPEAGRVSFSGVLAGRGVVVVTHPDGLRSSFEPITAALPSGAVVAPGQTVAVVSAVAGHCAPLTCLHWGVRRGTTYLDPLAFVGRAPLVLLPLR